MISAAFIAFCRHVSFPTHGPINVAYWKILFVGEDQKESVSKLILVQHALQLLPSLNNTISIVGVNDEDDALSILEIVSPQRSDLVLTTHIPHCELNVLVFDSLNVEACSD